MWIRLFHQRLGVLAGPSPVRLWRRGREGQFQRGAGSHIGPVYPQIRIAVHLRPPEVGPDGLDSVPRRLRITFGQIGKDEKVGRHQVLLEILKAFNHGHDLR